MKSRLGLSLAMPAFCLAAGAAYSQEKALTANEIMAKFVARVANYGDWPEANRRNDGRVPFVIGIIGKSELEPHLKKEIQNQGTLRGRPLEIRIFRTLANVDQCEVLFVSDSELDRLESILSRVRGKPILTISNSTDFARKGTIFNLAVSHDQLVYEANLVSLRESGINFDSRVLARAVIVAR